jgi:hypothetical protein
MDMVQLEREFQSYTRYLIGCPPTPYLIAKYKEFHQKMNVPGPGDRFDRFLLAVSSHGPIWTRLADSYASACRKNSCIRGKLVLSLALLECASPSFEKLDRCPAGGRPGAILRLGWGAVSYACALLVAIALFALVHLWMSAGEP